MNKEEQTLASFYNILINKKSTEEELLTIIEQNPQFIHDQLIKAEQQGELNHTSFSKIFSPYIDVIKSALEKRKKSYADGIIYNNEGKILMLLRSSKDGKEELDGKWSLPGGHIDAGETAEEAVKREVLEETNLVVSSCSLKYIKKDDKCVIHVFSCYVEQGQLDLILNNAEHFNFKWVDREELQKLDCIYDLKEVLNKVAFPELVGAEKNIKTVNEAIGIIKKAFDSGKIDEIKYFEYLEKAKKTNSEILVGGLADNKTIEDIANKHKESLDKIKEQINMGVKVEMEHTDDKKKAFEIAKDHLMEDCEYYSKLKTIEKSIVIIKQAFDNGQIDEHQFAEALSNVRKIKKAQVINIKISIGDDKEKEAAVVSKVEDAITTVGEIKTDATRTLPLSIIEYITHLININEDEKQKSYYEWMLLNAKQIALVPIKDIRIKYSQVDKFLKSEAALMKQTYVNATKLSISDPSIIYVEGFISINGVVMEHAFNKIGEDYFDITKDFADLSLSDNSQDCVEDCVSILELSSQETLQYALNNEFYGNYVKSKYEQERKLEKSDWKNHKYIRKEGDKYVYTGEIEKEYNFEDIQNHKIKSNLQSEKLTKFLLDKNLINNFKKWYHENSKNVSYYDKESVDNINDVIEINSGSCNQFANFLKLNFGGKIVGADKKEDVAKDDVEIGYNHNALFFNGKYYDSETPYGTNKIGELPYFNRNKKLLDSYNIKKAENNFKIGDTKNWHGRKFKLTASGWVHDDNEKNGGLKTERSKKKVKIQDFSDEDLETHANRSSTSELQKIIKDSRNPKLRDIAQRHLATRKAKENAHSLYDIMVMEDVEGDHHYSKDENTIYFDKEIGPEASEALNTHGIKHSVLTKEIK